MKWFVLALLICAVVPGQAAWGQSVTGPARPDSVTGMTTKIAQLLRQRSSLDDRAMLSRFRSIPAQDLLDYGRNEILRNSYYSYTLVKKERIRGTWPQKPDIIFVRYRVKPLALYLKWLPGGRHAGREVLYDSAKNADDVLAHEGGILKYISIHLSLDNIFVKRDSNHRATDLGLLSVLGLLQGNFDAVTSSGMLLQPASARITSCGKSRCLTLQFILPGQPMSYAKVATVSFELEHLYPVELILLDNDKQPFEQFRFEAITPLVDAHKYFSRDWKEYSF